MPRRKIRIEHPLRAKSASMVWGLIGYAAGLQRWLADGVEQRGDSMTFTWGEDLLQRDVRSSTILLSEPCRRIRLRWDDDQEAEEYWELCIERSDFDGSLTLVVTDHCDASESASLLSLWADNLARLHTASGI